MASATVHTPVKTHSKVFTTRAGGARMPLTPSPRTRQAGNRNLRQDNNNNNNNNNNMNNKVHAKKQSNASPVTPPQRTRGGSAAAGPAGGAGGVYGGNLAAHFAAALKLEPEGKKKSSTAAAAATATATSPAMGAAKKSSIARPGLVAPIKLDLGISDWTLTGAGSSSSSAASAAAKTSPTAAAADKKKKPGVARSRAGRTTVRINGDRFIPCRNASSPTASSKLDFAALAHGRPQRPADTHSMASANSSNTNRPASAHSNHSAASDVLAGGAFGTDALTNPAAAADDAIYPPPNPANLAYQSSVAAACGVSLGTRILAFKPAAPESAKPVDLRSQYNRPVKPAAQAQFRRRILTAPERVLDAPGLVDDYYLNLLDWSSSNQVAIGLERNVYVWNAESGGVSCLLETAADTYVSSVKWSQDGAYVAVGLGTGDVQIWDVEESTKLRTMAGHSTRVGVSSWNKAILSTGSRSGMIFNHDVRIAEHKVAELLSHTSEVCGLEWRSDGSQLASGGNDNLVNIWDARALAAPKWSKTNHRAAVKALAWCPWQMNLLATGGGSYDRHIHFWNSTTGARVNSIDTGSQVTSLKWSTTYKEIVSCHGFPDNQLSVWSYPTLVRNIEIPAHETRVLHSCLSPDGQTLATAASDESLKFWKLFEKKPGAAGAGGSASLRDGGKPSMAKQMTIR
ncbi:WD40-repeat-containing domain protein [Peziza echinospora]|nr:WD40-repeat-containing domain protein [Peziza echinospora]